MCYLLHMNHEFFEDFIASPVFSQYYELDRNLIRDIMLGVCHAENTSAGETVAFEGAAPEVVSMEVPAIVPMAPR